MPIRVRRATAPSGMPPERRSQPEIQKPIVPRADARVIVARSRTRVAPAATSIEVPPIDPSAVSMSQLEQTDENKTKRISLNNRPNDPKSKLKKSKVAKKTKKQPTGDYDVGYCRTPVKTRYDGSRPGPGRPPGGISQDALLRKHLTKVRPVAIEGKQTKMQTRELVLMLKITKALSGDRQAADYVLFEAGRLFNERVATAEHGGPSEPCAIDEHDRAILEALQAVMLADLRSGEGTSSANDDKDDDDLDDPEPVS